VHTVVAYSQVFAALLLSSCGRCHQPQSAAQAQAHHTKAVMRALQVLVGKDHAQTGNLLQERLESQPNSPEKGHASTDNHCLVIQLSPANESKTLRPLAPPLLLLSC
jgi:Tfp pilus assembly protein PilF